MENIRWIYTQERDRLIAVDKIHSIRYEDRTSKFGAYALLAEMQGGRELILGMYSEGNYAKVFDTLIEKLSLDRISGGKSNIIQCKDEHTIVMPTGLP